MLSADEIPHVSSHTERQVLAACLLDSSVIPLVTAILRAEDFALSAHGAVFRALQALSSRGETIDYVTLYNEMRATEPSALASFGGWIGILALTDSIPTTAHVSTYARLLADHSRARRIGEAARIIQRMVADPSLSVATLEAMAHTTLRTALEGGSRHSAKTYRQVLDEGIEDVHNSAQGEGKVTSTGLRTLDEVLAGGLRAGELVIVAARPAMGKSALAWQMAESCASSGTCAVYISLEMSAPQLGQRALAARAGISLSKMRAGKLTNQELDAVTLCHQSAPDIPLEVHDVTDDRVTVGTVHSIVAAARAKRAVGLVVVDYLQLLAGNGGSVRGREATREREVAEMSRGFKLLARREQVPVVILAQLNRGPENRDDHRPRLSDLRESGSLEQDADLVLFPHREYVYSRELRHRGDAEIIVAKQRQGEPVTVQLRWEGEHTRFVDLESVHLTGSPANDDFEMRQQGGHPDDGF